MELKIDSIKRNDLVFIIYSLNSIHIIKINKYKRDFVPKVLQHFETNFKVCFLAQH